MPHNNIVNDQEKSPLAPKSKNHKLFWLIRANHPPYNFHVWTVWSELVQSCRKGRSTTAQEIAENTGISKHTSLSAVARLISDGLAVRSNRRIVAVEPPQDCDWVITRKSKREGWTNHIAYFVVEFHPELSLLQNILLGRLKSLPQLHHQSYTGLAKMLGVKNRADIKRVLEGGAYSKRPLVKTALGKWTADEEGATVERSINGLVQHEYVEAVEHRDDGYLCITLNPFRCPADDVTEYAEFSGQLNGSLKEWHLNFHNYFVCRGL